MNTSPNPRELAAQLREYNGRGHKIPHARAITVNRCTGCGGEWPCLFERSAAALEKGADAIDALALCEYRTGQAGERIAHLERQLDMTATKLFDVLGSRQGKETDRR